MELRYYRSGGIPCSRPTGAGLIEAMELRYYRSGGIPCSRPTGAGLIEAMELRYYRSGGIPCSRPTGAGLIEAQSRFHARRLPRSRLFPPDRGRASLATSCSRRGDRKRVTGQYPPPGETSCVHTRELGIVYVGPELGRQLEAIADQHDVSTAMVARYAIEGGITPPPGVWTMKRLPTVITEPAAAE